MKYSVKSKTIPFLFFCVCLTAGLPAAAFENSSFPVLETNTLPVPDILAENRAESENALTADEAMTEEETQETSETELLTEEFWAEFEDSLPQWMDLGSFAMNRLNGITSPTLTENGWLVEDDDGVSWLIRFPWGTLRQKITSILENCDGDWSVYLKDLTTGNTMEINEHAMQAASLIKLYIAGTTLEKIENGELEETDTITNALYNMITVSDNESANVLVRSFCDESGNFQTGLAEVNDFIARYGFSNTEQINGIADPSLWVSDGRVNETSAADCGRLLELLYEGELVSEESSARFESLLNQQEVNYKIPAALPEGTDISHKTGEVNDTENDVAIIYSPYGDYIFCILSTDLPSTDAAVDTIHTVTLLVYDWFVQPEVQQADEAATTEGE